MKNHTQWVILLLVGLLIMSPFMDTTYAQMPSDEQMCAMFAENGGKPPAGMTPPAGMKMPDCSKYEKEETQEDPVYVPPKAKEVKVKTPAKKTPGKTTTADTLKNGCPNLSRSLAFGMSGRDVASLQNYLIKEDFLEAGNNTGFFGVLTEQSVRAYQREHKLVWKGSSETTGYGVVGPKTRSYIRGACGD